MEQRKTKGLSRRLLTLLTLYIVHCSLFISHTAAQEITVNVTPVQQVLPPQLLLYVSDPGKYFNITLVNNSDQTQNVYLALQLEQTQPAGGMAVATPAKRMPQKPFSVAAGGAYQLTLVDMKNLFNHVPKNEVQTMPGLFDDYVNGSFGLLPEGQYQAKVTAYKWAPALATPVALSSANSGTATFTICYKAQAPQFIMPALIGAGLDNLSVGKISRTSPMFTWRTPVVSCNPAVMSFTYDLRVVEMEPGQQPDDAMDHNPTFYQQKGLLSAMAQLPKSVLDRMKNDKTYVAQVTAQQTGVATTMLNYVMLENQGKSTLRMFQVVDSEVDIPEVNDDLEIAQKGDDGEEGIIEMSIGDSGEGKDSLYYYEVPNLETPSFFDDTARKLYIGEDIGISWRRVWHMGGEGQHKDDLKFEYDVQLFTGEPGKKEEILKGDPIYSFKTTDLADTIRWSKIKNLVHQGDYMVLRVKPLCTNETSIGWEGEDEANVTDFAMVEHVFKEFFQCASTRVIEDKTPTTKDAKDIKTIEVGQYVMQVDKIEKEDEPGCFSGTGYVVWEPLGFKTLVAVKFDKLYVNQDDVAYDGLCETYQSKKCKSSNGEVVDKLFSEWGIDNLFGDVNIPYSKEIEQKTTSEIKNVAQKLDIAKYYDYIKSGESLYEQFLKGEVKVEMPLSLPKEINKTPCDVQIVSMKFAPTYATMDVLAEFVLPDSKYTKNDILMLGAPRLCISPDRVIPEGGTFALLGDFTVVDPESKFEMTFNAPKNVLEPVDGTFISWSNYSLELLDIDVSMKIPKLKKVGKDGKATKENPVLNFHTSLSSWDDWFAACKMDDFTTEDMKDWIIMPGETIIYDHSTSRNADGMGSFPKGYDKVSAGLTSSSAPDVEWQGLYIGKVGLVFPDFIELNDNSGDKSYQGRLKLAANNVIIDGAGSQGKAALSCELGVENVFDKETGKIGGWGLSMDKIMLVITQNSFKEAYFNGKIKTPLDGLIGYRCDIYAQGKDANGLDDPDRYAFIFKTQQIEGLKFDFWVADMEFDQDQTYFLVESEYFRDAEKEHQTKVELSIGGIMNIEIAQKAFKAMGINCPKMLTALLPGIQVSGMRLANCERWKSHYTQNMYETPDKQDGLGKNQFFGWGSEECIKKDDFYFSLGRWSLSFKGLPSLFGYDRGSGSADSEQWIAALEGGHGPMPELNGLQAVNADESTGVGFLSAFDFTLDKFNFKYREDKKEAVLTVGGLVSFMGGCIEAGCALDFVTTVDLKKMDFAFKDVEFNSASFKGNFGVCEIGGELAKIDDGVSDGYSGSFLLHVGTLFKIDIEGSYANAYTDAKKTKKRPWGYFIASVEGDAIECFPVTIKGIKGGFYFNCRPTKDKPEFHDKCYGGVFGMTIAATGGEATFQCKADLTLVFDVDHMVMSDIILVGDVVGGMGLLKGKAKIAWLDDGEKERSIEVDVSVTSSSSPDAALRYVIEEKLGEFNADFAQKLSAITEQVSGSLQDLIGKDDSSNSSNKASNKGSSDPFGLKEAKLTSGETKVHFNFKVTIPYSGKTLWHAWLGTPSEPCSYTHIDYQVGKRDGAFAAWLYLGANGYLCAGNELPGMQDPPKEVMEYLFDENKKADKLETSVSSADDIHNQQKTLANAIKSANDAKAVISTANDAEGGGFMLGLQGKGDFGVNAGIVYCSGTLIVGADMMIKKYKSGALCQGGGTMGRNGWYGLGQVYACLMGELGVMLDLWFFEGKVSLIDAGFAAMLQGGAPNPCWAYGKVKAHASLLNGLYKFNKSIEMKAGRVCVPDYGDPLDDIKIFSEATPGKENDTKYSEESDPEVKPKFVTNFIMNHEVRLLDEGKGCERSYKFEIEKCNLVCTSNASYSQYNLVNSLTTQDSYSFNVKCKPLEEKQKYCLQLQGRAWEWDRKTNAWVNPEIKGKNTVKRDNSDFYFKTGELPPNINNNIALSSIGIDQTAKVRLTDAQLPYLSLTRHRATDLSAKGKEFYWILFRNGQYLASFPNNVMGSDKDSYEKWAPTNLNNIMAYELFVAAYVGPLIYKGTSNNYRWALYSFDKGKGMDEIKNLYTKMVFAQEVKKKIDAKKETTSNQQGVNSSARQTSGQYFGATSDPIGEMNKFFADEAKEMGSEKATVEETTQKIEDYTLGSFKTGELNWHCDFSNVVTNTIVGDLHDNKGYSGIMDYDRVFWSFNEIGFSGSAKDQTQRGMYVGASTLYDTNVIDDKAYKMSPYWALGYITRFMFLGGRSVYDFKHDKHGTQTVNNLNPRGVSFTLPYGPWRTGNVKTTQYDGLHDVGYEAASNYRVGQTYELKQNGKTIDKHVVTAEEKSLLTSTYGHAFPAFMPWKGHDFHEKAIGNATKRNQLDADVFWGTTQWELTAGDKAGTYTSDIDINQAVCRTLAADAYGIYRFTIDVMNQYANKFYKTFNDKGYIGKSQLSKEEFAGAVQLYKNWQSTMAGGSLGSVSYQITKSTSRYKNNSSTTINLPSIGSFPVNHMIYQMFETNILDNKISVNVEKYFLYPYRLKKAGQVWDDMRNWQFDWKGYLKSISYIEYWRWKATYYDFEADEYRLEPGKKNTHASSVRVNNPFNGIKVDYESVY